MGEPLLEECPKWGVLKEILEEIETDVKEDDQQGIAQQGAPRVLVAAQDDRTCNQLKEVLDIIV